MDLLGQTKLGSTWAAAVTGALRPGMALGRYELLVPVGIGGMACVWAARLSGPRGFSKLVAIKTVLPHLATHRDFENMLLDEARIVAGAHHPNVCNLFDVGEDRGVIYLVLEWVNGDSLLHLLRSAPAPLPPSLDYRVAARIVADACAGLHAAHELNDEEGRHLGVVHRDVSPHNVLVSLDGTTKIADFGIAKAQGQLHQTTRTGEIRGKLAYMAPEQMSGGPIDRRADVFGMGAVLYHATTGMPPFRGENDARLIRAIIEGSYEAPEQVAVEFPPQLSAITKRALSVHPEDRFETAEAMRIALEEWLARESAVTRAMAAIPTTTIDVGEAVRQRIGALLGRRQQEVRAALEAGPVSESTRPVRSPPAPLAPESGVLRATSSPSESPALAMQAPMGALLRAHSTPAGAVPGSVPSPAPRRVLKIAMAVGFGLLTAAGVLVLRSALLHLDLERGASRAPAPLALAADPMPPAVVAPASASSATPNGAVARGPLGPTIEVARAASPPSLPTVEAPVLPSLSPSGRPSAPPGRPANSPASVQIPANPY